MRFVASDKALPIGQVMEFSTWDENGNKRPGRHPFFIIREASRADWEAQLRSKGAEPFPGREYAHFYEVSTD